MKTEDYPVSLQECAEVHFYLIGDKLGEFDGSFSTFEHGELNEWIVSMMRTKDILLTNNFPYTVELFWHEESKSPVFQGKLEPPLAPGNRP